MMFLFSDIFDKFADLTPSTIAILVLLSVAGLGGIILIQKSRQVRFTTRMLVYASVSVALSFAVLHPALSHASGWKHNSRQHAAHDYLCLYIRTRSRHHYGNGLWYAPVYSGSLYSPLGPVSLDYPVAFGMLGLAGFSGKTCCWAVCCHPGQVFNAFSDGYPVFAEYAGDQHAALYSLSYNGSYLGVEFVICAVIVMLPQMKYDKPASKHL